MKMIEKSSNVVIDKLCGLTKLGLYLLAIAVPYILCLLGGIQGRHKYMRLMLVSLPVFMGGMIMSSWLMVSNPAMFAVDAFGTASGAVTLASDIKRAVPMPEAYSRYGVDHAVSMAGNATGLRKTGPVENAKSVVLAPFKWMGSLWRVF